MAMGDRRGHEFYRRVSTTERSGSVISAPLPEAQPIGLHYPHCGTLPIGPPERVGCLDGGGVRDAGEDIDALAAAVLTALSRQEQRARGLDGFMHDATVEINVEGEGYNGLGDVSR